MEWVLIVITVNATNVNVTRFETERQCEEIKVILTKTFDAKTENNKIKPAIGCYKLTTPKGV